MTNYLLIETRDPFESRDTDFIADSAIALQQGGHNVTVFLIQNGVFAARGSAGHSPLDRLSAASVTVLADDFSLAERGILSTELNPGVQTANIESLVDALVRENTKALWH